MEPDLVGRDKEKENSSAIRNNLWSARHQKKWNHHCETKEFAEIHFVVKLTLFYLSAFCWLIVSDNMHVPAPLISGSVFCLESVTWMNAGGMAEK